MYAVTQESWSQVSYIERGWDSENKVVVQTERTLYSDYTELSGTGNGEYYLASGEWYVVKTSLTEKRIIAPPGSPAHLIVCDGATLKGQITIEEGHSLNIYGQAKDTGTIVASSADESISWCGNSGDENIYNEKYAAIGCADGKMGTLTVHGCTITATSSEELSGIGGGTQTSYSGSGGRLIVYGGSITSTGGKYASGIGGASRASGGDITIYGGTVKATGGKYGAGIGGGYKGNGGTLTV